MNRLEIIGLVVLIGTIYLIYSTVKENDYRPFKWAGFTTLGLVFIVVEQPMLILMGHSQ